MKITVLALSMVLGTLAAGHSWADDPRTQVDGELTFLVLEGTVWKGEWFDKLPVTVRFDRKGVLEYSYSGTTYRNGTWKQDGLSVYMETNKKYAEFRGVMRGEKISGNAGNVAGGKWAWWLQRVGEHAGR